MILFSAFNIAQNLVTQIFSQEGYTNLGQYCIFAIYGCFGCSSFVVSNIKAKLSHKMGLIIGASGYFSFLVAGAVGCYCIQEDIRGGLCTESSIYTLNIVTASYLGFCAGLLWLSQSSYVDDCTNPTNTGFLNGLFWSLCQTSQILGSLIGAFVLGNTNHFVFYLLMCCMAGVAIILFIFLPSVRPKQISSAEVLPVKESISKFIDTFKDKRMQPIFPVMFFTGIIII
jgi:Major Facilitator Superfamily.